MHEREWIIPSIALTVLSALVVLNITPDLAGLLHAMWILPSWLAMAALLPLSACLVILFRRGVASPIGEIRGLIVRHRQTVARSALFMVLAGLNMIAFMWMKPLLNQHVPFWADPMLADLDRALFLGLEPWTLLTWLNVPASGFFYHPAWFIGMIAALLLSSAAPPSPDKSAVLLGYFTLWSAVAPLIHSLLPAAGPIFYERMGYGARFAALNAEPQTQMVSNYLWGLYSTGNFGAGSGISAMPSMHVAISTWTVIAIRFAAPRWFGLALAAWAIIFTLSVALGWHYAADGLVGTLAALVCHYALLAGFRARSAPAAARGVYAPSPVPAE